MSRTCLRSIPPFAVAIAISVALVACTAEPALVGTASGPTGSPWSWAAAPLWSRASTAPSLAALGSVALMDDLPSSFELPLEAPDERFLDDLTGDPAGPGVARVAVGFLVVTPVLDDPTDPEPTVIGVARDRLLVYLDGDAAEGTAIARLLGGSLEAGFHLMQVIPAGEAGCPSGGFDCMREAPAGLLGSVHIDVAPESSVRWPDWG